MITLLPSKRTWVASVTAMVFTTVPLPSLMVMVPLPACTASLNTSVISAATETAPLPSEGVLLSRVGPGAAMLPVPALVRLSTVP